MPFRCRVGLYQVKAIYKGYDAIRKKHEIYGIPLKREPTAADTGMSVVMDFMPGENNTFITPEGKKDPWWQSPSVHWYIIRGQHTVTACRELPDTFPNGSDAKRELLEFEVIPVFSRNRQQLVRVSNALNLNIAQKVARETFRSCAELGRNACIRASCL